MTRTMPLQQMKTMKMNSSTPRRAAAGARATVVALALALGAFAVGPGIATACAQQRGPVQRTVQGEVHDHNDQPLKGAVVYLKDSRTLAIKSFISDDGGVFHFGQLSQNTDYDLYAEFQGKRSKTRHISSFDSRNDFNFTLKIEAGK
ncbi:MAG TPA: carboxypeptidase-like regulatory domain-containing protein [Acidobacteriaceae bacterium]|nr:carboxypeptidase-like regulatory domain-containing protein [Acidobacteriaceae bacterium]